MEAMRGKLRYLSLSNWKNELVFIKMENSVGEAGFGQSIKGSIRCDKCEVLKYPK